MSTTEISMTNLSYRSIYSSPPPSYSPPLNGEQFSNTKSQKFTEKSPLEQLYSPDSPTQCQAKSPFNVSIIAGDEDCYHLSFEAKGFIATFRKFFLRESPHFTATLRCDAIRYLDCELGETKKVNIPATILGAKTHLNLKIQFSNDPKNSSYLKYKVTPLSTRSKIARFFSLEVSFSKAIEKELNYHQLQSILNRTYLKSYANESRFSRYDQPDDKAFDYRNSVSLIDLFQRRHTELANLLGFTKSELEAIEKQYESPSLITHILVKNYCKEHLVTWQEFFNLLCQISNIGMEPEFHRAAKMLNVQLPAHWSSLSELPIAERPVCQNPVQGVTTHKPKKTSQEISIAVAVGPHAVSFALSLGLSTDELLYCQNECYGEKGRGSDFESWNHGLTIKIISFYMNKHPLNWRQLFDAIQSIPELKNNNEIKLAKDYFHVNESKQANSVAQSPFKLNSIVKPELLYCICSQSSDVSLLTVLQKHYLEIARKYSITKTDYLPEGIPECFGTQVLIRIIELKVQRHPKITWKALFEQILTILEIAKSAETVTILNQLLTSKN